jgi:hypothetical protein
MYVACMYTVPFLTLPPNTFSFTHTFLNTPEEMARKPMPPPLSISQARIEEKKFGSPAANGKAHCRDRIGGAIITSCYTCIPYTCFDSLYSLLFFHSLSMYMWYLICPFKMVLIQTFENPIKKNYWAVFENILGI